MTSGTTVCCTYFFCTDTCCHIHTRNPDAHAIYLLNLLLAFLQPKFDPSLQDDLLADELEGGAEDTGAELPSQRDDEFRPFVRRLPEWQFWYVSCALSPPRTFDKFYDWPQAVCNPRVADRAVLHVLGGLRRAGLLADPRHLLLHPLHADDA